MAQEVAVTRTNWFSIVPKLNPETPVVIDGSRHRPEFVFYGYDGTNYRVQRRELQALIAKGKLPIWLLARLVESDMIGV